MLVINSRQLAQLRAPHLEAFYNKAEAFLKEQVRLREGAVNWPLFVRAEYQAALRSGRRSEREIVHFMLDKLEQID